MKANKKNLVAVLLIAIFLSCSSALNASEDNLSFKYAFIRKAPDKVTEEILDFAQKPQVKTGDQLRIFLQPIENAFLYVFLESSQKNLDLMFPETPDAYDNTFEMKKNYYVPGKTTWFEVDKNKGDERFYILASSERLTGLEEITKKYLANNKNDEYKAKVLEEIKNVRQSFSRLASNTETGVPIAGTFRTRGLDDSTIIGNATHVDAKQFYGKTLRLTHE